MIEAMLQAERLLLHGMVDQAEAIYRSAIERDPNNAIAVVGLARVAVERGDERQAYQRARDALAIDPQNAAALRLEARLSEIMTARGEAVERPAGVAGAAGGGPGPAGAEPRDVLAPPSEQAALARNRSMADARQEEDRRAAKQPPTAGDAGETQPVPGRRGGLMRRLLGRNREEAE